MNRWGFLVVVLLAAGCGQQETEQVDALSSCAPDSVPLLHVASPDWRDQVIYMLFIDRFDDGDPSNNDQGRDEYDPAKATHFSGGDIQGIINRVDYLQDLGVTAVWMSPPVYNQWWSSLYQATGWHGYWATDFRSIDPHFGTLDDYKRLSSELHCNDMYLIQDIVANHTANWWTYDGKYDPDDTAKNFRLLEEDSYQPAPTQEPFHMIDRLNPEHVEADIYHWTPSIVDYGDISKRYTWQLGALADINTENPVVIQELKDSYKYWIEEVGVDGFRIDTVIYVPFEFWNQWAHDDDGIYAHARKLGKEHFLSFGETFLLSDPFDDAAEREIVSFMETNDTPGLNSMLGFPLYQDINRVLARGEQPKLLEYRLEKFMEIYPDPFVIPNFIDNHDTARFLASGHVAALRQALAMIFTIPGIPVIYQGTEQALPETRMAMFAGGHHNAAGSFDPTSEHYQYIQSLTALRRSNPVLTRGDFEMLAAEDRGPGLLAYRRDHQDEAAVVLFNTANHSILVDHLDVGLPPGTVLDPMFSQGVDDRIVADANGAVSLRLPARAIAVLKAGEQTPVDDRGATLKIDIDPMDEQSVFADDFVLSGQVNAGETALQLIINGDADRPTGFSADATGRWNITVPVGDLGTATNFLQVFAPGSNTLSERLFYKTSVNVAAFSATTEDAANDAFGPDGSYQNQLHPDSSRQREIEKVDVRGAGRNLEVTLTMAEVTDVWLPPNGFDNVAITTFIDLLDQEGATVLPLMNGTMPAGEEWDLAHFATGWITYMYRAAGATADLHGEKLGVAPVVTGSSTDRTIKFMYEGAKIGVENWSGARLYVTTWDSTAEGVYVDITPEPSEWFFGADDPDGPQGHG